MTVHSWAWSVLYFLLHHLNLADRWVQINTDNLFWGKFSVSIQSSVTTTLTLDLENTGGVQREGEEGISSVTSVDFRRFFFYAWLNICTSFTTVKQLLRWTGPGEPYGQSPSLCPCPAQKPSPSQAAAKECCWLWFHLPAQAQPALPPATLTSPSFQLMSICRYSPLSVRQGAKQPHWPPRK